MTCNRHAVLLITCITTTLGHFKNMVVGDILLCLPKTSQKFHRVFKKIVCQIKVFTVMSLVI